MDDRPIPVPTPAGRLGRVSARTAAAAIGLVLAGAAVVTAARAADDPVLTPVLIGVGQVVIGLGVAAAVAGLFYGAYGATQVMSGDPPDPGRPWVAAGLALNAVPVVLAVAYVVYETATAKPPQVEDPYPVVPVTPAPTRASDPEP